jgi:hypothetical protein
MMISFLLVKSWRICQQRVADEKSATQQVGNLRYNEHHPQSAIPLLSLRG